jgi:hypothetical protein
LQGQGIPVELHDIDTELTKLWGPAAAKIGGPEVENPTVTRVALANLVVECFEADGEGVRPVLETVVTRFPCRAIVLRDSRDTGRKVTAEVSALCHLPAPGLPQVCSERIVLHASDSARDMVPGALRPLLEADLPFVLWWTGDPRRNRSLIEDLADECSRLILDLPDPGADPEAIRFGLDPALCASSRDSAWFGLPRWRELVAQFFDPSCHKDVLGRIKAVRVEAVSVDPTRTPRLALWLVAWLAGQLGWTPEGSPSRGGEAPEGGSILRAQLRKTGSPGTAGGSKSTAAAGSESRAKLDEETAVVSIEVVTRPIEPQDAASLENQDSTPPPVSLTGVTLTAVGSHGDETFRLTRPSPGSPDVRIEADASDYCRLPRTIYAPELGPAHRIAAALESSRTDPPFRKALPILLWLLGTQPNQDR